MSKEFENLEINASPLSTSEEHREVSGTCKAAWAYVWDSNRIYH